MSKNSIYISNNIKYTKNDNSYEKNNIELKDEDGNPINTSQFNRILQSEIYRKYTNYPFDNVVLLVGAGASVVIDHGSINPNYGQTVSMIAESVFESLNTGKYSFSKDKEKEVFRFTELLEISRYTKVEKITVEGKLSKKFDLEDFLSNLFAYEKFVIDEDKEKFTNSKMAILDIIKKKTSYEYDENVFKHIKLLKIISRMIKSENKLNLVTTNYDTLLEDAAGIMKFTVFDGFSFSQIPTFDSTMFDWNLIKDVPNVKTHENIYKTNVINLLKIHGSLTWEYSEEEVVRKNKSNVDNPIMIFPSSNKYAQSYQEPYFELFSKFRDLLKRPNTLLMTIGFSFADNHISRMILSAIQTNTALATLVTDYNIEPESPNENWKQLNKMMEDTYQVAFLEATMNGNLTEYFGGDIDDD